MPVPSQARRSDASRAAEPEPMLIHEAPVISAGTEKDPLPDTPARADHSTRKARQPGRLKGIVPDLGLALLDETGMEDEIKAWWDE